MTTNTDTPDPALRLAEMHADPMDHDLGFVPMHPDKEDGEHTTLRERYAFAEQLAGDNTRDIQRTRDRFTETYTAEQEMLSQITAGAGMSKSEWSLDTKLKTQRRHLEELERKIAETRTNISVYERQLADERAANMGRHTIKIQSATRRTETHLDDLVKAMDRVIDPVQEMENAKARNR